MKLDEKFLKGIPIFYFRKIHPDQISSQALREYAMTKKSRRAYELLRQAEIKCYWFGSNDKKAPCIAYDREYRGIRRIKRFIKKWKKMKKLLEKQRSSIPANYINLRGFLLLNAFYFVKIKACFINGNKIKIKIIYY
ncbi:MAG: hypothetical protein KAS12_01020 [Candidatus Aenigmarchaeota archaeon]|nr:hypothetical protein [Candidatus Aenigmarchaeota archaeon]